MPMTRSAPASSSARVWPPSPSVQSAKTPPRAGCRASTTSATSTGSCVGASATFPLRAVRASSSDAVLGQRPRVLVAERLALELAEEPIVVPHFQIVVLADHVDFAGHRRRLAQARVD